MAGSGESLVAYLDSSALVKLVVDEAETVALRRSLVDWPLLVSSCIAEVELLRVVKRVGATAAVTAKAREILGTLTLIDVDAATRAVAAALEPPALRAFDAIHLATALGLAGSLVAFVGYDRRLLAAATAAGLPASAPGATAYG